MEPLARRRVAVTGIGMVSPLGADVNTSWQTLLQGISGCAPISLFDCKNFPVRIACEVKDFQISPAVDIRRMARFVQFAITAADEALRQARLPPRALGERVGVYLGNGVGGLDILERAHERLLHAGASRVSPLFVPSSIDNIAAGYIAMSFGSIGPNMTFSTACASGAHAIGEAAHAIQRGRAEVMICGGTEASITPLGISGFAACRALSRRNDDPASACRPWDEARDGFVMGEGAAILILEEWSHAIARNAEPIAEWLGYGASADGYHVTAPSPDGAGAVRAMAEALNDAGLGPTDIGYINAHAASTPAGDAVENAAIKRLFADHSHKLLVSATKSMTGHLLGAAGALEAAFTVLALRDTVAPPTINLRNPSPDCDLDYVRDHSRSLTSLHYAMSNSFGFGGTNACLVFGRARL